MDSVVVGEVLLGGEGEKEGGSSRKSENDRKW